MKFLCSLFGHQFGDWKYSHSNDCNQMRVCKRSADHQETRILHDWGQWDYFEDNKCDKIRTCKRSEQHQETGIFHDWTAITDSNCSHCGGAGFYEEEEIGEWWAPDPGDKYPTVNDLPPEAFQEPERTIVNVTCDCKYHKCNRCNKKRKRSVVIGGQVRLSPSHKKEVWSKR
jgi:hypothetical protein